MGKSHDPLFGEEKQKHPLIGFLILFLALVLTVVIVLVAAGGTHIDQSTWDSTVESYVNAIRHEDANAVMSLLPIELFCAQHSVTEAQVRSELDAFFQQYSAYIDFGSITYTVSDVYDMSESALDSLNKDYAFYMTAQQTITEGKTVRLLITYPIKGSLPTQITSTFYMLRIGTKWYAYNPDGGF